MLFSSAAGASQLTHVHTAGEFGDVAGSEIVQISRNEPVKEAAI